MSTTPPADALSPSSSSPGPVFAGRHAPPAERLPSCAEWDLVQGGVLRRVTDARDLVSLAVASALLAPACCSALDRLLPGPLLAAVLLDSAVECRLFRFAWDSRLIAGTAAWCCTLAARADDTEVGEAAAELLRHCNSEHSARASLCWMSHLCVAIAWRMDSVIDVLAEHWRHSDCGSVDHGLSVFLHRSRRGVELHNQALATAAFTLAAMQDDAALLGRLTQPPCSLDPRMAELPLPESVIDAQYVRSGVLLGKSQRFSLALGGAICTQIPAPGIGDLADPRPGTRGPHHDGTHPTPKVPHGAPRDRDHDANRGR
eukprot:m51a1_g14515 hypothetical protein (316) ;mRNA; r:847507-850159